MLTARILCATVPLIGLLSGRAIAQDGYWNITNGDARQFAEMAATPGVVSLTGDFNNDGRDDIALLHQTAGWNTVPIAFAQGDGSWNITNREVGAFAAWAATPGVISLTGDFNNDGRNDITLLRRASGWASVPVAFAKPPPSVFDLGNARSIRKEGTRLRDAEGRTVLLRGFNFGARSKLAPFLPVMPLDVRTLDPARFAGALASAAPQFDLMQQIGVSAVRLVVSWKALEPSPQNPEVLQPTAIQYLQFLTEIIDALYARQIYVFIDFHQDIAHERLGGDGFPDWALKFGPGGAPPPADMKNAAWGLLYYADPPPFVTDQKTRESVRATLRSLWENSLNNGSVPLNFPVRTHLEKTIGQVARFFKDHPAILGYELFNEPMPVGLGNAAFESTYLSGFYANAIAEINRFDTSALIFVEPRMTWNVWPPNKDDYGGGSASDFATTPVTSLVSAQLPAQDRLIFSFHYYDPRLFDPFRTNWNMTDQVNIWPGFYRAMVAEGRNQNMVPFLTEFGGGYGGHQSLQSKDPEINPLLYQYRALRALIDLSFQQVEANFLHATWWNFDLYNSEGSGDHWNHEDFSFLGPDRTPRNWDLFARPYPLRSSANPQLLWFDAQRKNFALILSGRPVGAPTIIFIPQFLQFSTGFDLRATSPAVQWDEKRQMLAWWPDPQQNEHAIIISPPQGLNSDVLPANAKQLLGAMKFSTTIQPSIQILVDRTIGVPESATYVDTDVYVAPGQFVEFQASGTIRSGVWFTGANGPAGWNTVDKDSKFPFHNGPYAYPYSLIGQIGYNPLFYIGTGLSRQKFVGVGSAVKHLRLRTNDDSPGNGEGSFYCRVLVSKNTPRPHNSIFARQEVPVQVQTGGTYRVKVTMRNAGGTTWVSPIRLGSQNPQDNLIWGLGRVELSGPVAPGAEAMFDFFISAPSKPGTYNFQWRMVHEGVTWFGPSTPSVAVSVTQ